VRCFRFPQKRQGGSAPISFSGFTRKHLFITACIEKHGTPSLSPLQKLSYSISLDLDNTKMLLCKFFVRSRLSNLHV